jgi:HEAT repeat protein
MNPLKLKNILQRTLKVKDGEWRLLLTMAAMFFLLFTCLIYGRSIRSSLFLKTFSIESLPMMYLLTYVVLAVVATIYAALVDQFDKKRMLAKISIFFSILFLLSKYLIVFPAFVVFIFVAVEINSILTIIQFWTLCDDNYTGREAKRFFPLIMLFGLATASTAALSIKFVVQIIQAENIFILLSVLMFINYLILHRLKTVQRPRKVPGAHDKDLPFRRHFYQIKEGFNYIAGSRFMLAYTAMTMSIYLVNGVIEFEFANTVSQNFLSLNELTQYFGLVQGSATFLAFLTQMFFTSRIIEALGIQLVVLLYPAAIFSVVSVMTFQFGLFTGTLSKITNDLFLYSIHDTVSSVLLNPIPERLRGKARIFIQGIVRPAAAILSSLFLIFAIQSFSTKTICLIALAVVVTWFIASRVLGKKYLDILVENLEENEVDLKKYSLETLSKLQSKDAVESLTGLLNDADEKHRVFAAHLLYNIGNPDTLSATAELVYDPLPQMRTIALRSIKRLKSPNYDAGVLALIKDPDRDVRREAIEAYAETSEGASKYLSGLIETEEDPYIKWTLLRAVARLGESGGPPASKQFLERLVTSNKVMDKVCAATAIAEMDLKPYGEYLIELLKDKNEEVVKSSIDALGRTIPEEAIPHLIPLLGIEKYSAATYETLLKYKSRLTPHLEACLAEGRFPTPILPPLLSILGDLGDMSAKKTITGYLDNRYERVRLCALKALHRLQEIGKERFLSMEEVLRLSNKEVGAALETIILNRRIELGKYLGGCRAYRLLLKDRLMVQKEILLTLIRLTGDKDAVTSLKQYLQSKTKKVLDCALETLETLLPSDIRRHFMLVFDERTLDERIRIKILGKEYSFDYLPVESILMESAANGHTLERLCAIFDLGEMRESRFIHIFLKNKDSDNLDIREAAFLSLSKLDRKELALYMDGLKKNKNDIIMLQRFDLM